MTRIIAFAIIAVGAASFDVRPNEQAAPSPPTTVDFNRDIRPIFSENCFVCHGPDEEQRKAKLRLDTQEGAFAKLRRGGHAIVPGKSADSELVYRVTSESPTERMPPPKTDKKLSQQQIDLLKRWIDQGAAYSKHWAFVAPKRPSLPKVNAAWPRNGIDRFILARLQSEKLQPSPEADRVTLIRRLTLDLTGLPPTPMEVDAFIADKNPDAYEKLVDRLLSSPHYGERMAVDWLDAARFADTHGYHIDSGRDMTRWREWVIEAFNRDLPFDQFTVDQLAGDLLPDATLPQKIASGFNRNHMINFEGGAIPEEYLNNYIVDRVNTTATVWLGLTMTCAQCHDHKYDPISQKEFYQLYAFFNNVPESGLDGAKGNAAPLLSLPTKEQKEALAKLDTEIESLAASVKKADAAAKEQKDQLTRLQKERDKLRQLIPSTMVMQDIAKPRDTHLLVRGEYNKKAGKVQAGVPAALTPLPKDAPPNRLGLARWLVDPSHPLMARVIVNRYWQLFFGTGLVKTVEDFGAQGELPSHPELLDWLAVEFMQPSPVGAAPVRKRDSAGDDNDLSWSTKRLVRLIVTSATYRQSSKVTSALVSRDPENRLLARGPRFRLQAEFIRDQALAVSGLLNREIGGKSVSPYQPAGLWQELHSRGDSKNWTAQFFVQSKGKDLYRRTMYTFWKRTSPPPQLATFDAPDREVCTVRRSRTNTPLQALVLMNDPTYVEAARKLAERLLKEAQTTDDRLTLAFRLATARTPGEKELGVLRGVLEKQLARYRQNEEAALKLLAVGESPRDERIAPAELAAWTMVSSVILNLDETITKG
ncbi:MAG: PSD1 and planctomycete cytochrome C domain-containing protein [Gemmataceae bacterium]|nr:PSD1 and planctomycete cytochrome C domain-containing protein [Gemmataceae bacterium]MCI0740928.1 PSD1 and planctomycete cytochrome C domain-containing protein [Gemmataceae bacterium]